MDLRYEVPGWPVKLAGHSAVTPNMNRLAASGAQQYKDGVTGQPGTQAIPCGTPRFTPSPDAGDIAQMGVSRSSDAPDVFYPNLYFARPQGQYWPGAGMPVSRLSDNLMPVPATDPRGIPAVLAVRAPDRGNRQIRQPATLVQWPNFRG